MPSAQERLKEDGAEEKNNDFSSEPSSRAYTPPLPPLATPEYVRYLQEQRRGDLRGTQAIPNFNLLLLLTAKTIILIILIILVSLLRVP
jgi:hypothetical protein